jgi:hypothetical protein
MGFIHGANCYEEIWFPERLDDNIAAENPVRFLDAFVDHLDLTILDFQHATPAAKEFFHREADAAQEEVERLLRHKHSTPAGRT